MTNCSNNPLILYGGEPYYEISKKTLGQQFLYSLRKRDYNDIVNIDGETGKILTCGKLIERSVKLATVFKNLGLKHGDAVCIISENNNDYYMIVLAAFYNGITVSLINPDYTLDELKHGFQFSSAKIIICSSSVLKHAIKLKEENNNDCRVILISEESYLSGSDFMSLDYYITTTVVDINNFEAKEFNTSETSAFIFLSSGTTGLPKGVLLTHRSMAISVLNLCDPRYAAITPEDKLLTVLPFFHMFGNLAQLVTLALPITTIILKKFTPSTYLDAIQKYQPSKLFVVPSLISFLSTHPLVDNYDLSSITQCISAGAIIEKPFLIKAKQKFPSMVIRQMYGITETSGFCAIHILNSKDENVGVPIPTIFAKVRNVQTHELLGPYQHGEICLKGPTLMKEYIANVTETKNAFDNDGFYCTGDIGYYDENKCFFIVGRIKEIIKCKGFQVAPSELERLILAHPQVEDCGVIGIPHERFGEAPLAFVVPKNYQCVTQEELINYVAERITKHKQLYGGVRFVDAIPKSSAGKILRAKLKEML